MATGETQVDLDKNPEMIHCDLVIEKVNSFTFSNTGVRDFDTETS